jgi:hypothetical protein
LKLIRLTNGINKQFQIPESAMVGQSSLQKIFVLGSNFGANQQKGLHHE